MTLMVDAAAYDWSIAGLKFASAVDAESPMERAFARVTKESIDDSPQPGDQSLDGWWVRSQTDWSGGAGYRFMEPMSEDPIPKTFNWSYGVDVWNEGKLTLHRLPRFVAGNFPPSLTVTPAAVRFGLHVYVSIQNEVFRFAITDLRDDNFSTVTLPDAYATLPSPVTDLVVAAGKLLAFTVSDGVYRIESGTPVSVFTSTNGPIRGWWVKDRLIMASGPNLYEEAIPAAEPVALNTTTPLVTSTDPGWVWVSITHSPGAILAAGRSSGSSTISSITIESDGGLPTLSAPAVVAEMPLGEFLRSVQSYLGSYLLLSTNLGVRLGVIDGNDRIVYGPLLTAPLLNTGFSTFDRFAYAGVLDAGEGRTGLIRFDLSQVTSENKVPWANDIRVPSDVTGSVDAIVAIGMNEVFMVAVTQGAVSIWMSTRTSVSEDYGVLQSGAIRMGTTVEKNWARLGLTATPPMRGQVQSYLITSNDSVEVGSIRNPEFQDDFLIADSGLHSSVAAVRLVLSKGGVTPPGVITTPTPPDPVPTPTPGPEPEPGEHSWNTLRVFSWLEVRDSYDQWLGIADTRDGNFNVAQAGGVTSDGLNPDDVLASDADQTPVLESWSLKAVPAIERTELMRIPLSCFDWELDSRGQKIGGQGTALARYEELTSRVGAGTVVDLRNLNTNRLFKVVVDDLSFRQTAPGSRGSGFGGVVDLVVRVLA